MKAIIISGSSRNNGDTARITDELAGISGWDVIDLNDYNFSYYDYEYLNKNDDFKALMQNIILNYDAFVFVTPVYWYAMSGIMKVFFDRITDLLDHEQELIRKMKGKKMATLSISNGDNLGEQFWLPFRETANYLAMDFIGGLHTIAGQDCSSQLKEFFTGINNSKM